MVIVAPLDQESPLCHYHVERGLEGEENIKIESLYHRIIIWSAICSLLETHNFPF